MQHSQGSIFWTEVVAPLAYAMRLVNSKQAQLPAFKQRIELRQKTRRGYSLRRGIQERHIPAQQTLLHLVRLLARQCGIEKSSAHAGFMQCAYLVVHQRDQWGNNDSDAAPCALSRNRGNLVTKRLATAGGHEHQRIAALAYMLNNGLLWPAERVVTKYFLQDAQVRQRGDLVK